MGVEGKEEGEGGKGYAHRVYGEEDIADLYAHDREEQRCREASAIRSRGKETVAGVRVGRREVPEGGIAA